MRDRHRPDPSESVVNQRVSSNSEPGIDRGGAISDEAGHQFVAFDLETTGLSLTEDRIIEVGAVRINRAGEILATFERLINPQRTSGFNAQLVHGISPDQLSRAESAAVVLPEFVSFLGDPKATTLLAHNAAFDAGIMGRELLRIGLPLTEHFVVDTLAWSRRRWPRIGSHKLDRLARRFGFESAHVHRALVDSLRVRQVYLALRAEETSAGERPPLAYPIHDGGGPPPIPRGWSPVAELIDSDVTLRIEYLGGTRGLTPRDVTPKKFAHRGGVAYLVAVCHLDHKVKEFQIDRVLRCEVVPSASLTSMLSQHGHSDLRATMR